MKKILLILALCGIVMGCAAIKNQAENAKACAADPVCLADAAAKSKSYGDQAGTLAGLSGLPWASTVAKPVVSYSALVLLLCTMGAALRKKENA